MSTAYRQARETSESRIYTAQARVYGMIHLIPGSGTADLLNADSRPHLPVTGALMYAPGFEHPPKPHEMTAMSDFIAVSKSHIRWLVGGKPSTQRTTQAMLERRRLAFIFGNYILSGQAQVVKGGRLSDFLASAKPFQTLLQAGIYRYQPGALIHNLEPAETFEFVTVNLQHSEEVVELPLSDPEDVTLTLIK
jgi:hypothetical protein